MLAEIYSFYSVIPEVFGIPLFPCLSAILFILSANTAQVSRRTEPSFSHQGQHWCQALPCGLISDCSEHMKINMIQVLSGLRSDLVESSWEGRFVPE